MFALVFTRDGRTERHLLATGDTTVGRSPACDLVIADPSISRRHARFRVHGDHCLLSDLGGRNGTFRNGELVVETDVEAGDTITLGRFPILLQHATDAGLALSDHQPIESPVTVSRRVDEHVPDEGAWHLTADASRLFGLMSSIARRVVHWHSARELMEQIVDVVFDTLPVERAFLLMPDPQSAVIVPCVARSRVARSVDGGSISRALAERVMTQRLAILSSDRLPDLGTSPRATAAPPARRWFVAAPLWNQREALGVLYADNPETRPLAAADLDLLHALALYAASAIEQARDTDRLILDARRLRDADEPNRSVAARESPPSPAPSSGPSQNT
jgi:hypothetical protein